MIFAYVDQLKYCRLTDTLLNCTNVGGQLPPGPNLKMAFGRKKYALKEMGFFSFFFFFFAKSPLHDLNRVLPGL